MSAELKLERRARAIQDRDAALRATFYNEQLTRSRVDALESRADKLEAFTGLNLLGRLRWLLLGVDNSKDGRIIGRQDGA